MKFNRCSPWRCVVHFLDYVFKLQSRPCIVYLRCFRSSSFSIAGQGPFNNSFFKIFVFTSHDVTEVSQLPTFSQLLVNFCWHLHVPMESTRYIHFTGFICVRANFFLGGGAELSFPETFFNSARKTAMLTCKITLPDSPHPITIGKNPRFRVL